jgi:hypothetical protein
MGSSKGRFALGVQLARLTFLATACPTPPPEPTVQPVPNGGRVIATGRSGTTLRVHDTSADLSTIVYEEDTGTAKGYRLYDDVTHTTTVLPVTWDGATKFTTSDDGSVVVFASTAPSLQPGPLAKNCKFEPAPFQPPVSVYCSELYLYDRGTGAITPLTGTGGSSPRTNVVPSLSPDGSSVSYVYAVGAPFGAYTYRTLVLATGEITESETPPPSDCCRWTRGANDVYWENSALYSEDLTTGTVTKLSGADDDYIVSNTPGGAFVVTAHVNLATGVLDPYYLIDTDARTRRNIPGGLVSHDGTTYLAAQSNVAPGATSRLILGNVADL